ncbi:hypothetical protein [Brevundimonas sp. Bb-A]|jgi:hypothetical protein|uniref:hypothetical protein n=1 Tax=Brevundimonas sp. Bb-A TaxID=2560058 RepID=UPI00128F42B0|nr:hypothetical protein [Brevundimonas sp. Bb-A]QFU30296.1 hypothetical protein BSP_01335 [Brevundimonas sp. Bb-A]
MSGSVGSAGRVTPSRAKFGSRPQPSAGQLALALIAAARIMGVAPEAVFDGRQGARRARILAGAALKGWTGCVASPLAAALRLSGPELSPSMVSRAGVTTDMILEVVEALNGVTPAAMASDVRPVGEGDARPLPAAAEAETPARKAASEARPVTVEPVAQPVSALASAVTDTSGMRGVFRVGRRPKAVTPPEAPSVRTFERAAAVQRLKPMTSARLRYCGWFVAAGWDLHEVADLFDVHEDALADALEFGVAA